MPNCSLLLVGDRNQLPSVGPGSVLKDVIASGLAPVVELTQVYRQAGQSRIVTNAHRINRGELPEISNAAGGDFFFIERASPEDVVATIKQLVSQRLIGNFRHHRHQRDPGPEPDEPRAARGPSAQPRVAAAAQPAGQRE